MILFRYISNVETGEGTTGMILFRYISYIETGEGTTWYDIISLYL